MKLKSRRILLTFLLCISMLIGLIFSQAPVQAASPADVLINEVAWMGTTISADNEWMELRNMTDSAINLTGWTLNAQDGTPSINLSGSIGANSYYLLERTSGINADLIYTGALGNSGEILELKDNENNLIDSIDGSSSWPAGDNTTKQTMERCNADPAVWLDSQLAGGTPKEVNSCPAVVAVCGNGILEGDEECDDNNTENGDGCSAECLIEEPEPVCGNGIIEGNEECDDNNLENGDGCSSECLIETIEQICGNGILEGDEQCDDGNTDDGDGCSAECIDEIVEPICGNGIVEGDEECDDNNLADGDGCSDLCMIEVGLSARGLKEKVKQDLENSKTGDSRVDNKIDHVLKYIDKSLQAEYWLDDNHVSAKKGLKVFYSEYDAVQLMQKYLCISGHEGKHCCKNEKNNKFPEEVKAVFEQAIKDLVEADKILAETALAEARNMNVNNPRYLRKYDRWIRRAERKMNRALKYEIIDPDIAMDQFDQAWQFAQEAIEVANY